MSEKNILEQVKERIAGAENILVALSRDPNVDEMAGAIGLTMALDEMGKHATAIYSGVTPNALEFLKPEETFEKDTNSLQDFIIALNKEKADHLRYKIEGDYVRVYITPYKTTISEKDLEFSHGDFNVDLVIALDIDDVANLDAALSEYGRIMHDATAVNITTGKAGKFAETEWSEPGRSSVCEMIVELLNVMDGAGDGAGGGDGDGAKTGNVSGAKMTKEVATALLTGIVAETDRFSNDKTTPETMNVASELMKAGADQKLIADNVELGGEKPVEPAKVELVKAELEPEIQAENGGMEVAHEPEVAVEEPEQTEEQKTATEQLEQMIQPPSEEETAMEQLRQVANEVELPKFELGQNPAEVIAPEMTEKEANNIPEMNFGGGDVVNIVPPNETADEMPITKLEDIDKEIELPPPPAPPVDTNTEPELPKIEIGNNGGFTEPLLEESISEEANGGETNTSSGETEGFFEVKADEKTDDPSAFKIPNVE
ncbi:hypothetical protein IJI55_00280 [Candidatus Saccharibacteria bacterium]|nr:hypothetical protein [Candidatus Saccharibacteria bacterium]